MYMYTHKPIDLLLGASNKQHAHTINTINQRNWHMNNNSNLTIISRRICLPSLNAFL